MHYKEFRIRNFKGIKDTTVSLAGNEQTGVFTFVGLNESGKTTVLEAIHSFSPDRATSELVDGEEPLEIPYGERVPRHLISSFTGDISVLSTVVLSEDEIARIASRAKIKHSIVIDQQRFPTEIILERHQRFRNGDFERSYLTLRTDLYIKKGKQRSWRRPDLEERDVIKWLIYGYTPDISYFPTFVFNFPKEIFLSSERGGRVNKFYRRLFQDILDYDGHGHTIEETIVRRVRSESLTVPWLSFWGLWGVRDDKDKIQHVMDRASAAVTKVVFGRWNKIFHDDAKGKEVLIAFDVHEGERADEKGVVSKTNEHDIAIKFQIRDGTRRFDVNDRSLGFRWFFAFMMFTQFRVARDSTRPVLFLFDEPASNLHAAAQQKLIESFPEIAKGKHKLVYTTHSHYMIEPKWLEQSFIVTNRSDAPPDSMLDEVSLNDESLDIKDTKYRQFANSNPGLTSYFQPILDRLEVVPSRFDIQRASIILEGKSDYYIVRYAARLLNKSEMPIVPGIGAGSLGALVALHVGWGLRLLFVLDGDKKGREERDRYINEYALERDRIVTISELSSGLRVIEDLLDAEALAIIQSTLQCKQRPSKNQIRRFFQEHLASDTIIPLGKTFRTRASQVLDGLNEKLVG